MFIKNSGEFVAWGGSTEERRRGRTAVAESQVTINVPDAAVMERCLTALEESDARLAAAPDSPQLAPYDWTIVYKDTAADGSGSIHFGVVWYDTDYYGKHRETFKRSFHGRMFKDLGISADNLSVTHWNKEPETV
ncbi:hypothetical protein ACQHIV_21050 [Kribbella sp. GL6]|uniref:hypothetical protein n=1 Tax=Kribbella sp. GL6 TaxID=3419765 RepID=UPI003CFD804D